MPFLSWVESVYATSVGTLSGFYPITVFNNNKNIVCVILVFECVVYVSPDANEYHFIYTLGTIFSTHGFLALLRAINNNTR